MWWRADDGRSISRTISRRELCNDSGAILREVQAGQTIIVSRNGVPVANLRAIAQRRFVPRAVIAEASRAWGRVFAAKRAKGRSSRTRLADLLIAATAAAHGLPLCTRNPGDIVGLDEIVHVFGV